MKILIGTPIHYSKNYSMKRWIQNVAKLQRISSCDVLLVDNSPTPDYTEIVKSYLEEYKVKNYQIIHIEVKKNWTVDLRIEYCQEVIRQYVLSHNYDAWFSWECDQIIPADALNKLIKIMADGGYGMVVHNSKARWDPDILNTNMGVTLISHRCLNKTWFLPTRNGKISTNLTDTYDINTYEYKKRVLASKESYLEVFGVIKPIYHLNN